MAEKDPEFGKRLNRFLTEAGVKKKKLADLIGISPSAVGTYIKEGRIPEAPILLKIAQLLNKSMEELLKGELQKEKSVGDIPYKDPKLTILIEKLEIIYRAGDFDVKARLRGTIEELYDEALKSEDRISKKGA